MRALLPCVGFLASLLLVACGVELGDPSAFDAQTRIAVQFLDASHVGAAVVSIGGLEEPLRLVEDGLAVSCEDSPWVVDAGSTIRVVAESDAGFIWDFEAPAEEACLTVEISLGTTATGMLAVVTLDQPVTVRIEDESAQVSTPVTWEEIGALHDLFDDLGALRRSILALEQEGKVALLMRPPGRYQVITWYKGHRSEEWVRFYEGWGGVSLSAVQ